MKYTIELTEKQVQRVNDILLGLNESWGYPKGTIKLEPIKTTNVEDTIEYQIGYKTGYDKGFEDGNADATYNTDLIDELKQVEYIRGLEDGYKGYKHLEQWFAETCFYDDEDNLFPEYNRRQADTCCLEDIITDVGFVETLNRAESYEEKKNSSSAFFKVGDVIYSQMTDSKAIIISFNAWNEWNCIDTCGTGFVITASKMSLWKKIGHIDEVEQLLDKLRGEDNE